MADEYNEPRKAAWADFAQTIIPFEIESPTGDVLIAEFRVPTAAELLDLDRDFKRPMPPTSDIQKIGESLYPVYNTADPDYLQALAEYGNRRGCAMVARFCLLDIPGETEDDKIAALSGLPAWAQTGLMQAVNIIAKPGAHPRRHTFQPVGMAADEVVGS